jgi:hypothetical protein
MAQLEHPVRSPDNVLLPEQTLICKPNVFATFPGVPGVEIKTLLFKSAVYVQSSEALAVKGEGLARRTFDKGKSVQD